MGFRFQKRIRILPGVRINLSKTGISTSLGGKGVTVNLRDEKVKTTLGIPGTGLSYSTTSTNRAPVSVWLVVAILVIAFWLML